MKIQHTTLTNNNLGATTKTTTELNKINSTYAPIAYTNLKKQPIKNDTTENKSTTERPKNAQIKALSKNTLNSLICFGLVAGLNTAAKAPSPMKDATLVATAVGLIGSCFENNNKNESNYNYNHNKYWN